MLWLLVRFSVLVDTTAPLPILVYHLLFAYSLNASRFTLQHYCNSGAGPRPIWIVKPTGANCGNGVRIVHELGALR
jgi:hypothetical protein